MVEGAIGTTFSTNFLLTDLFEFRIIECSSHNVGFWSKGSYISIIGRQRLFASPEKNEDEAMTIQVQYRNGKSGHVDSWKLNELIDLGQVKQFYRPSENKWIDVELDPMRGKALSYRRDENRWVNLDVERQTAWEMRSYDGTERRHRHYAL